MPVSDVLFVVSAALPDGPVDAPGPRKDFVALSRALQATVLDYTCVTRSREGQLVARVLGMPVAQAWLAFRRRRAYRAVLTDGEHIGLPLALLFKIARCAMPHVTIGHRIVTRQKRPFFRWLKVHSHISRIALHSSVQHRMAIEDLGLPVEKLALTPYQVDTDFWRPQPVAEEAMICSAGLEHRDYPTLFQAVAGLEVRVEVAAASYWSHQRNTAAGATPPPNVNVGAYDYHALRDLYARASLVVVPLFDVDFQAGITTILEAMAMGKAVIVTRTRGQTDAVEDGSTAAHVTSSPPLPDRSPSDESRPDGSGGDESLLRRVAAAEGVTLEPNGLYVPPGDAAALRQAITHLLEHPEERAALGAAGRRAVEQLVTVDKYTERMTRLLVQAGEEQAPGALRLATSSVAP